MVMYLLLLLVDVVAGWCSLSVVVRLCVVCCLVGC